MVMGSMDLMVHIRIAHHTETLFFALNINYIKIEKSLEYEPIKYFGFILF